MWYEHLATISSELIKTGEVSFPPFSDHRLAYQKSAINRLYYHFHLNAYRSFVSTNALKEEYLTYSLWDSRKRKQITQYYSRHALLIDFLEITGFGAESAQLKYLNSLRNWADYDDIKKIGRPPVIDQVFVSRRAKKIEVYLANIRRHTPVSCHHSWETNKPAKYHN